MVEFTLIVTFCIWLLLTILWQFHSLRIKLGLSKVPIINQFLPSWTFFAPTPGMFDTHLLYRNKMNSGEISDWNEVPIMDERKWFHFVWNPNKRTMKLIVDSVSELKSIKMRCDELKIDDEKSFTIIKVSKGYLILLNFILSFNPKLKNEIISRQFAIAESNHLSGKREFRPIFLSAFHSI